MSAPASLVVLPFVLEGVIDVAQADAITALLRYHRAPNDMATLISQLAGIAREVGATGLVLRLEGLK